MVEHNLDLAGPRLLGRDVRTLAAPQTLEQIRSRLGDPAIFDRLVTHMARALGGVEDPITAAEQLLDQFKTGLAGS